MCGARGWYAWTWRGDPKEASIRIGKSEVGLFVQNAAESFGIYVHEVRRATIQSNFSGGLDGLTSTS